MWYEFKYIMDFDGANPTEIFPLWSNDQTLDYQSTAGQYFKQRVISGEFLFKNRDFDLVQDAPLETKFTINVFKREQNTNGIFLPDFYCYFYRTERKEVNVDRKEFKVEPTLADEYQPFLDSLDKIVDLRMNPPAEIELKFYTQPVFQIYEFGRAFLTNVLGGISFEQELNTVPFSTLPLLTEYFFGFLGSRGAVIGEDLVPDVAGDYVDNFGIVLTSPAPDGTGWVRKDGAFRIEYDRGGADQVHIYDTSTETIVYTADFIPGQPFEDLDFNSLSSSATCKFVQRTFWGRMLSPKDQVLGGDILPEIPENDIVAQVGNYKFATGIGTILPNEPTLGAVYQDIIICANDASEDPTQYSKFPFDAYQNAGLYYKSPAGDGLGAILPLGNSAWNNTSFWFQFNDPYRNLQIDGSVENTIRAWKLPSVVAAMLSALGLDLTHEEAPEYSDFLYNDDNAIRDGRKYPVISTKSRILVGENAEPERRAEIKFVDILNLLQGEQCFPFIRDGKLVFEHVQYFWNGGSYDGLNVATDLSTLIEPRTNLPWDHEANVYNYERSEIPSQIRAQWMDQTSLPFDGLPIEPVSNLADPAKIDDITISMFTADIDFMQIAPDRVSKNGFFFGEAIFEGGEYKLPFVELTNPQIGGYVAQNGYASMVYMMATYFIYNAPTSQLKINLETVDAVSVKRTTIQELTVPNGLLSDQLALISTKFGPGRVRTYKDRRLGSGSVLTLELPTQ